MPSKRSGQKPRPQISVKQQKRDQHRTVPQKCPQTGPLSPRLSRSLPASTISQLSLSPTSATSILRPSPPVKIKKIDAPTHPANGQFGLFAASNLPAKSFILDYLGYVHDSTDTNEKSDYDLCLHREFGVGVDAQNMGNEARMVNDYRGVPGFERPNVVFETRRVGGGENGELRMALWVGSKDIKKGVELCVSYGKGFWQERMKEEESAENKIEKE